MHGSIDTAALLAILLTIILMGLVVAASQLAVWLWDDYQRSKRPRLAPRDPENLDPYGPQNHEVKK